MLHRNSFVVLNLAVAANAGLGLLLLAQRVREVRSERQTLPDSVSGYVREGHVAQINGIDAWYVKGDTRIHLLSVPITDAQQALAKAVDTFQISMDSARQQGRIDSYRPGYKTSDTVTVAGKRYPGVALAFLQRRVGGAIEMALFYAFAVRDRVWEEEVVIPPSTMGTTDVPIVVHDITRRCAGLASGSHTK